MWQWCRNCGSLIILDLLGLLIIASHKVTYVVCRAFVQSAMCVFSENFLEWRWDSNNKVPCLTSTVPLHYWSKTSRFHNFYSIQGKSELWLFKNLPKWNRKWIEKLLAWTFIKSIIMYPSHTHTYTLGNLHQMPTKCLSLVWLVYHERHLTWITKYIPSSFSCSIHWSYVKCQT
jgi:hypothetical protein